MIQEPEITEEEIQAEIGRMRGLKPTTQSVYDKRNAALQGSSLPVVTQTQSPEAKAKIAQIEANQKYAESLLNSLPPLQGTTTKQGQYANLEAAQKAMAEMEDKIRKKLKKTGGKERQEFTATYGLPTNLADIENINSINQAEIQGVTGKLNSYKEYLENLKQLYNNAGQTVQLPGIIPTFDEFQSLMTPQEQTINAFRKRDTGYTDSRGIYHPVRITPDATTTSKLPDIKIEPPKDFDVKIKQAPTPKYEEFKGVIEIDETPKTSSTPRITSNIGTPEAVAGILDTYGNLKSVTNKAVSMVNPSSDNYNTFNNAFFDVVKKTWGRNVGNNLSEVRVGAEQSLGRAIAAKDANQLGQWAGLFSIDRDKGTVEFSPNMVKVKTDIEAKIYDKIKDYDYKKTRALFRQGFVDADKKGDFVLGNNAVEIDQAKRNYARLLTQAGMSSLFNPDARQKFEQLSTTPKSGK